MPARGPGRGVWGASALWAGCLALAGCHVSLDYSLTKPPPTVTAHDGPRTFGEELVQAGHLTDPRGERLPAEPVALAALAQGKGAPPVPVPPPDRVIPVPPVPPPADAALPFPDVPLPTELDKAAHPPYVIEPPDVLAVEVRGVRRQYLVLADGTIFLGAHGPVYVAGMNLGQARRAIERRLAKSPPKPTVAVELCACNSKGYYVILNHDYGIGCLHGGQDVVRLPATGNETVLDAVERIGGLPGGCRYWKIWVARPVPACHDCLQLLPVDWEAITQGGSTRTNYQLFPGDRVYLRPDPFRGLSNFLERIFAPVGRTFRRGAIGCGIICEGGF